MCGGRFARVGLSSCGRDRVKPAPSPAGVMCSRSGGTRCRPLAQRTQDAPLSRGGTWWYACAFSPPAHKTWVRGPVTKRDRQPYPLSFVPHACRPLIESANGHDRHSVVIAGDAVRDQLAARCGRWGLVGAQAGLALLMIVRAPAGWAVPLGRLRCRSFCTTACQVPLYCCSHLAGDLHLGHLSRAFDGPVSRAVV